MRFVCTALAVTGLAVLLAGCNNCGMCSQLCSKDHIHSVYFPEDFRREHFPEEFGPTAVPYTAPVAPGPSAAPVVPVDPGGAFPAPPPPPEVLDRMGPAPAPSAPEVR